MMIRFANYLAIAAFALVTLGMRAEAHADTQSWFVIVRVDTQTNPSHYANAASSGTLRVCVDFDTLQEVCQDQVLYEARAAWDYQFSNVDLGTPDIHHVTKVWFEFKTPGDIDDLLVVDQLELRTEFGYVRATSGADNETGHCFSNEAADFSNSHCNGGTYANAWFGWPI
jgi:hypothetical protein